MKIFLRKILFFLLFSSVPFPILILGYIYFDPFKVLKKYNDYSYPVVVPNRDLISTESLMNRKDQYKYNSFIFGSSRTLAFRPQSWKQYLDSFDSPFMFDASAESIFGIYTKVKFLDSIGLPIKNALIIICRDVTFDRYTNHDGHLFIKHPVTSGESKLKFHAAFVKAYFMPRFLLNFYSYKVLKSYRPFMAGYIEKRRIVYDTVTNELRILDQEEEILQYPKKYYESRMNLFYKRQGEQYSKQNLINQRCIFMLDEIVDIFNKHHTNYKVVISPLYEQTKFSAADSLVLNKTFGRHLYDYSGANFFTDSFTHYYEASHYRPVVGDSILSLIYKR